MLKKVLTLVVLLLLVGYVAFSVVAFCKGPEGQMCEGVLLEMQDSTEVGYMTTDDIVALLKKDNLDPTGRLLEEVSLTDIEKGLEQSPLIRNCECYKTLNGKVMVRVECRRPILRVMSNVGESYYLDEEGGVIEYIAKAVYLPVATGYITREYAQNELLALAQFLQESELWNAQVEQICVTQNGEIELVPRVGNHTIVLGCPGDYATKFEKLQVFYEKGLNELGWDRYSRINVGYDGQVVATKRK